MKRLIAILITIGAIYGQNIKAGTLLSGISTLDVISTVSKGVQSVRFRKTPEIITALIKGEVDLAVIPAEMAAKLYLEGHEILIVAADMFQNQAVLARSEEIKKPEDLKGKIVAALLASGTYMTFKSYMQQLYGLRPGKDFRIINAAPGALPGLLLKGDADAIVVWEPLVSLSISKGAHIVSDFPSFWRKLGYRGKPVMLLWVASPKFREKDLLEKFVDIRKGAAEFWINNPDSTVKILEKLYNFDENLARLVYSRIEIYPGNLDSRIRENIKLVWKIAWKGGYLEKNPENIPDSVFLRLQGG